jgi:truncated hemoglobin YjbI
LGKSLKEAHSKIGLSAPLFDRFKSLMHETMSEMGADIND